MSNKLGKRELEVLKLSYLTRKEIAEKQGVTESTVNVQRMQIFRKLNANTLVEAVLIALKRGLLKLDDFKTEV